MNSIKKILLIAATLDVITVIAISIFLIVLGNGELAPTPLLLGTLYVGIFLSWKYFLISRNLKYIVAQTILNLMFSTIPIVLCFFLFLILLAGSRGDNWIIDL